MEQGPTEKSIIDGCIRERRPLPERIANAPVLHMGLELYYNAFSDLQSDRRIGQSEGPIPWSAVNQYCHEYDITDEQKEDMHFHIAKMDVVYLAFRSKQIRAESATQSKSKPRVK